MFLFRSTSKAPVDGAKPGQHNDTIEAAERPDAQADMVERPRIRTSDSAGTQPHVADMVRPSRKVSGIRAAFERPNKRVTSNPPRAPQSPTKRQEPKAEQKMLSHEAELARLKDELEKERVVRKEAEAQSVRLEKDLELLKDELEQKDLYWREEMRKKIHEARQEGGASGRDMHSNRGQARLGDHGLHRQLTELKRSISKSTRVETVVTSDSTFAQEMGSLAHEIQNWTVNNYRRARISASADELVAKLVPLVNSQQLERLKPLWAGWKSQNKIAVLQSTVAGMLMDIFDDQLLFGMPPHEEWTTCLRKMAHHMSTVLGAQQYNKWRASTLDVVRQTPVMSNAVESAASTMAEYITTTLDAVSGQASSGTKLSSLQPIVRRTIALAHLFRIQRARFSLSLPAPTAAFDPNTMENIAFDREAEEGQAIDCSTFPLVLKLGDEHGANVQWQNVLSKANVVCGET